MYVVLSCFFFFFFFFNDTATTEIYTLSLHDALPILPGLDPGLQNRCHNRPAASALRSEEHTSELQSRFDLVCRLLLEKKKKHTKSSYRNETKDTKRYNYHIHTRR